MNATGCYKRFLSGILSSGILYLSSLTSIAQAENIPQDCQLKISFDTAIEKQSKVSRAIKADLKQGKKNAGRIQKYNNIIKSLNALKATGASLAVLNVNKKSSAILSKVIKNDSNIVKSSAKLDFCQANNNTEPVDDAVPTPINPSSPNDVNDDPIIPGIDQDPPAGTSSDPGDWGSSVKASANVRLGTESLYATSLQLLPANSNSVVEGFYGLMNGFSSPREIWNISTTGDGNWTTPILVTNPVGSAYSTYIFSYTAKADRSGGLHVFWVGSMSSITKSCYLGEECTLYYNYRAPNANAFGTPKTLLKAGSIGQPDFAFAPDGTGRLLFSVIRTASGEHPYSYLDYITDVYAMIFNGTSWSNPVNIETRGTPQRASLIGEFRVGVSANGDYQILAVEFVGGNRTPYGGVFPSYENLMHRTWPAGNSDPGPFSYVENDDGQDYETSRVANEYALDVFPDGSSVITWRQRTPYINKYGRSEYRYQLRSKRLESGQQANGLYDVVETNAPGSVGKVVTQSTVSGDKTVIFWQGNCVNAATQEVTDLNCIYSRQYENGILGPMQVAPRSAVGANLLAAVRVANNPDRVAVMSTEIWNPNGATYSMSYYNFTTGGWTTREDFSEPYSNGFAYTGDISGYNFLSALSNGKIVAFWQSGDTTGRSNVFTPAQ